MKRSIWTRVLAMLLVVSMLTVPVSAASWNSRSNPNGWGWNNFWSGWGSFWDSFWGGFETHDPEPETELVLEEGASTVDNGELLRASTYALTTVGDDGANSANAYSVNATADGEESTTKVTYFPVTMFNYDQDTINAATDLLDDDLTVREGFYFSNGGTEVPSTVTTSVTMAPGQYYIQNIRASENRTDGQCWLQAHEDNKIYAVAQADANIWTLTQEDGQYYLKTQIAGEDHYMVVGTGANNDGYTTTKTPIEIVAYSGNSEGVQLRQNGYYLCQWGGVAVQDFGGYNVNNDGGNGMRFYAVTDGVVSDTPTTLIQGESFVSAGYEAWNRWGYNSNGHTSQNKTYTGLVHSALINDQIKFNVNEPGVFDNNADIKDIYTYVGLPFVLNTTTGVYSFCSDDNGVYFADTDNDGDADPQSGTAQEPYNLYFDEGNTQGWSGMSYGDGSTNLWAPFNTNANDTGAGAIDYHFGMRADLPFSMTPNGRIKSTDEESTPITFSFQGDDDVWVFIDGHLVIDLGGIHNRLGATIDFAANTITYAIPDSNNSNQTTNPPGSHNDPDFEMTQKLFTDSEGTGIINMTRDAFAMIEDHEMQVFYLERGEGTSNAKIEFNLPMNDTVLVTKDATKSWSQAGEDADLKEDPDMEDPGVDPVTDAEQAAINAMNFGFTLYKKDLSVEGAAFEPVANTNFYLLDAEGNRISVPSTDANGRFYLKNGQTAKFITDIPATGITYYVVEDAVPDGFVTPDFNFAGEAVYGFDYVNEDNETVHVAQGNKIPEQILDLDATSNKSYEVTVKGSIEANDSIEFICTNYLNAELPNPSIFPNEEIIVIDYGLPVRIDVLANDLSRGDTVDLVYVGGSDVNLTTSTDEEGHVLATITDKNGVVAESKYLNKDSDDGIPFNFGTVSFVDAADNDAYNGRDSLVYTLNKQLTEVEVLTYVVRVTGTAENAAGGIMTQNAYATGKVYIVPATIMYYEENFSNMVNYSDGKGDWKDASDVTDSSAVSAYQEPGVVGTVGDSTYGSDVAYLSDSGDSNGTSHYGDTSNGAMKFEYTFTGTGSSFFARTSATTGYMQIKLYSVAADGTATLQEIFYRDTYYEDTNNSDLDSDGTLYNIPVFNTGDLEYGTYKLLVTIAKAGTPAAGGDDGSGNEFYLDGIRVMQPLNKHVTAYDENEKPVAYDDITNKALGAYATDGEANIEVVTLRFKMITDAELGQTPWNFVVLTDTEGEIVTVENYEAIGPKEEVYLNKGQTVSFALKYWELDGLMLYMGMKAPFGHAGVQVGKSTFALNNATDCYYDVTSNYSSLITQYEQVMDENGNLLYTDADGKTVYEDAEGNLKYEDGSTVSENAELEPVMSPYYVATFTFTATDSIVSLTNIKVVGNHEFVIVEDYNKDYDGDENEGGDENIDGDENEDADLEGEE